MLQSALDHYARQQRYTAAALIASRKPGLSAQELAQTIAAIQLVAARDALDSIDPMLDEQNIDAPPVGTIQPDSFAATASDGRPLDTLFQQATSPENLGLMVVTQIQDAARGAAATSIAARPRIGYVRMLNPPSCSRCAVLAGKFYQFNAGFQRHPRCDCRHIPSVESVAGDLTTDPGAYFDSLPTAASIDARYPNLTVQMRKDAGLVSQEDIFGTAGAEAIRQGADISQIVNVRRRTAGMDVAGVPTFARDSRGNLFTTEGSTRRGVAGQQQAGLRVNGPQQARLMPESILTKAKTREEAQRLLKLYGYILDPRAAARGRNVLTEARRAERATRAAARRAERRAGASGTGGRPPTNPPAPPSPDDFDDFEPEERPLAALLAGEGRTVTRAPQTGPGRHADALVDDVPTEFKLMAPGGDSSTIRNELNNSKRRGGQARNIVIDARSSGMSEAEAKRGLARSRGLFADRFDTVRIVGSDYDVSW